MSATSSIPRIQVGTNRSTGFLQGALRVSGVVALGSVAVLLTGAVIVNMSLVWLLPLAAWGADLVR
ncbi:hypothetical protein [Agromyces sp. NBRC 114283]|uniref:hypothetical protein n=1 Tax=Agromyces sp. NBRC 114283 TaxID=2994521 RepID=UPI0024A4E4F4|nr:hypothetical protein [Agromyces sp. NBRC 114283]GLU88660.1 hypothetical protein Agsp01_09150 [Agromyces sp. NBRC 114283]